MYSHNINRAMRRYLVLVVGLVLLLAGFQSICAVQETMQKRPVSFPTLTELQHKWDPMPLETVRRAAEGGDLQAQHYLGYCYGEGMRVPQDGVAARSWYERAGNAGYLPALNNLGLLYHRGKGVPQNYAKAVEYYRRAAEAGLPRAQANLGFMYKDGQGVERDPVVAMRWFRRAADNGLTTGMVEVGRLFRFGQGVPRDPEAAAAWFQKAAEKGDPLGELNLALLYEAESGSPRAFPLFRKAAEGGNADAMVSLYFAYLRGRGVTVDKTEALKWLSKSAQAGNAYGECLLGYRYENPEWEHSPTGDRLRPPNMPEAVRWYRRSADQNWAGGQYHLGLCYLGGQGVEQDEERGSELIRKAADQSQVYAMVDLANLYSRGVGAPRSESDTPLHILQRVVASRSEDSADKIAEAYEGLILRYEHGIGTERDVIAAVGWHCRAAMAGVGDFSLAEPEAHRQPAVGTSYTGEPGRTIISVAVPDGGGRTDAFLDMLALYLKAARGNNQAAVQIGNAYVDGQDAPRNAIKAWPWFSLAAEHGANAQAELSRCQAGMTEPERKSAKDHWPEFLQHMNELGRRAAMQVQGEQ